MKFIKNIILSNQSRLIIVELDLKIIDHLYDIRLTPEELNKYRQISNPKRKCEFLSIRKTIQFIYDDEEHIVYTQHGKPNLAISGHKISISHSQGLLGILLHPTIEVGLDLQHATPKIFRIKNRFLSLKELDDTHNNEWQMLTYWCAKEALYKFYSKGNVEFNVNLRIDPFELENEGFFTGHIHMPDMNTEIPLGYQRIDDTMAVYTIALE